MSAPAVSLSHPNDPGNRRRRTRRRGRGAKTLLIRLGSARKTARAREAHREKRVWQSHSARASVLAVKPIARGCCEPPRWRWTVTFGTPRQTHRRRQARETTSDTQHLCGTLGRQIDNHGREPSISLGRPCRLPKL